MRIEVTPECVHPDGFHSTGKTFVGQHVVISSEGVWLDGEHCIRRDRRAKKNREEGHPWLVSDEADEPRTGFSVRVYPDKKVNPNGE